MAGVPSVDDVRRGLEEEKVREIVIRGDNLAAIAVGASDMMVLSSYTSVYDWELHVFEGARGGRRPRTDRGGGCGGAVSLGFGGA